MFLIRTNCSIEVFLVLKCSSWYLGDMANGLQGPALAEDWGGAQGTCKVFPPHASNPFFFFLFCMPFKTSSLRPSVLLNPGLGLAPSEFEVILWGDHG